MRSRDLKDRELNKLESSGLNHKGTENTKAFLRGFCVFVAKFQVKVPIPKDLKS